MLPISPKPTRVYEVPKNDDSLIGKSLKNLHRVFLVQGLVDLQSALKTPDNTQGLDEAFKTIVKDLPEESSDGLKKVKKPESITKKNSIKEFKNLTDDEKYYLDTILRTDIDSIPARILLSIDHYEGDLDKKLEETSKNEIKGYKDAVQDQTSGKGNDLKRNTILVKDKNGKVRQISFDAEVEPKIDDIKDLPHLNEAQKDFIKTVWEQGAFGGGAVSTEFSSQNFNRLDKKQLKLDVAKSDGILIDLSEEGKVIVYNATSFDASNKSENVFENLQSRVSLKVDISKLEGDTFNPGTCEAHVPITLGIKEFEKDIGFDIKNPQVVSNTDYEYVRKEQIIGSIAGIISGNSQARMIKLVDKIVQNSDLIPQVVDGISKSPESNEEKKKKLEVLSNVLRHTVDHTVLYLTESKEGRIKKLQELKEIDKLIGREIAKTNLLSEKSDDKSKKYDEAIKLIQDAKEEDKLVAKVKVFNLLGPTEKLGQFAFVQYGKFFDNKHTTEEKNQFLVDIGGEKTIKTINDYVDGMLKSVVEKDSLGKIIKLDPDFLPKTVNRIFDSNEDIEVKKAKLEVLKDTAKEKTIDAIREAYAERVKKPGIEGLADVVTEGGFSHDKMLLKVDAGATSQEDTVRAYCVLEKDPIKRMDFAIKQFDKFSSECNIIFLDKIGQSHIESNLIKIMEPVCANENEKNHLRENAGKVVRHWADEAGVKKDWIRAWESFKDKVGNVKGEITHVFNKLLGREDPVRTQYQNIVTALKKSMQKPRAPSNASAASLKSQNLSQSI